MDLLELTEDADDKVVPNLIEEYKKIESQVMH